MNTDIRIAVSFRNHRKRKKLELMIGPGATGYLIDLWIGVAVSRPDGMLNGWDDTDIALEAGYSDEPSKFVSALCAVGFLDNCDGVYMMHDWQEHNPYASGSEERSCKARMSKLKQAYPGLHKSLSAQGVTMLTASEYQKEVSEWLAKRQRNASKTPAPKPSPSPNNTVAIAIAKRLREVVLLRKNANITEAQVAGWSKTISAMLNLDKIPSEQIETALDWYADNWNGEYIPVIESASALRKKWWSLLTAMRKRKKETESDWS